MGGAVGSAAHQLLPDYTGSVGAYALVGMGAAFAGIVRVPLTSVIMIFEVTRDYSIIVPLMIANLMSYYISSRLQDEPIYEALQHQDGIHLPSGAPREPEAVMTVAQAFHPGPGSVPVPVDEISQETLPHVHPDHPVDLALRRLAECRLPELPVVSRDDVGRVLGTISVEDILTAYRAPETTAVVPETTVPTRLVLRLLAAVVAVVMLAGFLNYFYRGERAARAQQYFTAGNHLMTEERYEEATEQYRKALSISHNTDHRLALAMALLKAGNTNEASIYLRQVSRERPNDAAVRAAFEEARRGH
jgi:CBS domain-containing protein